MGIIFNREWCMPNGNTFDMAPIKRLISRYVVSGSESADPFSNVNRIAKYTNDIDPDVGAMFNMDAKDFLSSLGDCSMDVVLFDPPYSPRQVSECYKRFGMTVNMQTTQSSFWSSLKDEVRRVVRPNGIVLSFGWNSNGIGKKRGFEIVEILIVAHGGHHNDTICVVERRVPDLFS